MRALPLVTALLLAACKSGDHQPDISALTHIPKLPVAAVWQPPADWATISPKDFEELALSALPDDVVTPLTPDALRMLTEALDRMDASSIRAAVLLGRSRSEAAGAGLIHRLQRRQVGPDRNSDAADVIAASALTRFPRPERYWRVVRLVNGTNPHPDIEVRVELACTALRIGIDRVIPFLLQIVRIGTWDGQKDTLDFEPTDTTAWIRGRAAAALSERAGTPFTYQTDAPIAMREREARRLADLLLKTGEEAPEVDYRLRK